MKINFIPKIPKFESNNIQKIWKYELILTALLLAVFLGWDLWIYYKKAEANRNISASPDTSKVVSLKKESLLAIDKKLQGYKDFLKNPKFTPYENF
ncbi:hypothetical protein A2W54_03345 [Candidatus Giovannonibacteria bacterium RIFCSPHIGHO2_02_43_13]|uniref:Uncharacterized protein n=1 Tax=Candidatus Giovannonibacteria bacterium RIFCSPHIGHO2_02_43_13 TaxID=1798330 RepID=A0A1F5WQ53_9BACT|nr:MAG: hypothetical protein UW28_C0004G0014 [Parcubacteria group bacterium GW2011_GWA2_44_13]OGF73922.1 MAG: hypothetical protein A3E06_00555 [Candidatus Giovannonibacteria bacterium RIFCSPHIGHO2_12_FULL_44_42]OGF77813.1 MAG: hypothetical protein A2W54_03345 [Candidatus Giovannonibacteria bacterium RIFCSPHIGHO2_02_43_13]OGF88852.1 MAG: hypothetical protein A3I94_02510 [Candidatus Giovannonibacteria bacterium RIFCSPLOWO2_02_FULL_43_54]OGF96816.1 MAG: hypothetical protein A3H08_01400 [Candidatus